MSRPVRVWKTYEQREQKGRRYGTHTAWSKMLDAMNKLDRDLARRIAAGESHVGESRYYHEWGQRPPYSESGRKSCE